MGMAILLWSSTYCQEKQLQLQICWAMCLLWTWQHSCGALASPPHNKKKTDAAAFGFLVSMMTFFRRSTQLIQAAAAAFGNRFSTNMALP